MSCLYYKTSEGYNCIATGESCAKVTSHFKELKEYIKYLAKNNIDRTFIISDSKDLCKQLNCHLKKYLDENTK